MFKKEQKHWMGREGGNRRERNSRGNIMFLSLNLSDQITPIFLY